MEHILADQLMHFMAETLRPSGPEAATCGLAKVAFGGLNYLNCHKILGDFRYNVEILLSRTFLPT